MRFQIGDVIEATQGAPVLWWVASLVVMIVLVGLALKLFGLWPE